MHQESKKKTKKTEGMERMSETQLESRNGSHIKLLHLRRGKSFYLGTHQTSALLIFHHPVIRLETVVWRANKNVTVKEQVIKLPEGNVETNKGDKT